MEIDLTAHPEVWPLALVYTNTKDWDDLDDSSGLNTQMDPRDPSSGRQCGPASAAMFQQLTDNFTSCFKRAAHLCQLLHEIHQLPAPPPPQHPPASIRHQC